MKRAIVTSKADVYRYLANKYKWTFAVIADMTPYQQAVALGDILEGDNCNIKTFDSFDEALAAIEEASNHER